MLLGIAIFVMSKVTSKDWSEASNRLAETSLLLKGDGRGCMVDDAGTEVGG